MKASHKRVKGKRFELDFAKEIRRSGLDKKARRRPMSGAEKMVRGRGDIISKLPFSFECKWQERMKFWQWWEQAEEQATMAYPPVLVFRGNYRPMMVAMKLETFFNLLKEIEDWKRAYEGVVEVASGKKLREEGRITK